MSRLLVLVVAGVLLVPAAASAAVRPEFAVTGAPDADGGRGGLVVTPLEGRGAARLYRPQDVGLPPAAPGDRFGAAVASVAEQGDVVVGAPGRDGARGAVFLVRAGRGGRLAARVRPVAIRPSVLDGTRSRLLATGFAPGDELGAAVSVAEERGRFQSLWVGAPGRRGGQGEVTHRLLRAGNPTGPTTTFLPGTPQAPSGSAADRRFGASLAATWRGALVGLPDAAGPGGEAEAGAVEQLRLRVTGPGSGRKDRYGTRVSPPDYAAGDGRRLTLPAPAAGDRFGAALSSHAGGGEAGAGGTVAGAPGADVAVPGGGVVPDAGAIATIGRAGVTRVISQADAVVPGDPQPGGAFGAGVATGGTFYEQSGVNLSVLSGGAGTVTFVARDPGGTDSGVVVGLPGTTAIAAVLPDYGEEDFEDVLLATTATGGASITRYDGGFDESRAAPVAVPPGAGRLVPAVPYRD